MRLGKELVLALSLVLAGPAVAQDGRLPVPGSAGRAGVGGAGLAGVGGAGLAGVGGAGLAGVGGAGLAGSGELRGQLTPRRFTTLASELAAKVSKVAVREGDRFKEGQVLVSLDCAIQAAQLARARAVLDSAEKLHASHRALAEQKVAGKLEAETSAMEAAKARGEVQVMQATMGKCAVAAPFPGRVVEQKVRDQQFVQAGAPMLDILDDSVLEIEFIMPSRGLASLKTGQPFQIHVEEMNRVYPAKVARIGARVDPVSQSVKVVGEVAGNFPELVAGMSGKILLSPP